MNRSAHHPIGWRVAVAIACAVLLVVAPGLVRSARADDAPLPQLSLEYGGDAEANPSTGSAEIEGGTWTPTPSSMAYQWYRNFTAIDGATNSTYQETSDDIGQWVWATATAHLAGYQPGVVTAPLGGYYTGGTTLSHITVDQAPTVSGTPQDGQTIVATPGSYEPSDVDVWYDWNVDGVDHITTSNSFTLTAADVAKVFWVGVYASEPGYAYHRTLIDLAAPLPLQMKANYAGMSGSYTVGSTLTAISSWDAVPDEVDYQWTRDGTDIPDATAHTYVLSADDAGHLIGVNFTASHTGVAAGTATAASKLVNEQFSTIPEPTISGVAMIGQPLTADPGLWVPTPSALSFGWYAGSTFLGSTPAPVFTPTTLATLGARITVQVTASAPGYGPTTATSSATDPVAGVPITLPTVKLGRAELNRALTPTYTPGPVAAGIPVAYVWERNGVAIPGASSPTYIPQPADWGQRISVVESLSDPRYTSGTAISNSVVPEKGWLSVGGVGISGTVAVGSKLRAFTPGWGPGTPTFHYRWSIPGGQRDGNDLVLSRSPTYTPSAATLGRHLQLSVAVTETHFRSFDAWWGTDPARVLAGTIATSTPPTISGVPAVGYRLTAARGTWSPSSGAIYHYQWFSATSPTATATPIPRATRSTFLIPFYERFNLISVRVSVSKTGYATATDFSAQTGAIMLPPG